MSVGKRWSHASADPVAASSWRRCAVTVTTSIWTCQGLRPRRRHRPPPDARISAASSPSRARSCPAISSPPTPAPASSIWRPIMARTISCCARRHGIDPVFAVDGDGMYRADWAWLGGQGSVINKKFIARRRADLHRSARGRRAARGERRLHAQLSASLALQGEGDLPRDAAMVHPDGPVAAIARRSPSAMRAAGSRATRRLRRRSLEAMAMRQRRRPCARSRSTRSTRTRWVPETRREPHPRDGRGPPRLGDPPPARLGRADRALRQPRRPASICSDPAVNARIVAAFEAGGADAWFAADHQALLGPDYDARRLRADQRHSRRLVRQRLDPRLHRSRRATARARAPNLYLEGSDQHRGWFQSSLLESCGTRGRAPYDAVLTHGFALDGQGRKMSKSLGNVVDPLKIIGESGADILRLWVASTDYFEDVRIGKEVLAGTVRRLSQAAQHLPLSARRARRLRRAESASRSADMPELERYVLHLLAHARRRAARGGRGVRVQPLRARADRLRATTICRPSSSISARTRSIATRRRHRSAAPIAPCSTCCSTRWSATPRRSCASPPRKCGRRASRARTDRSICSNGRNCPTLPGDDAVCDRLGRRPRAARAGDRGDRAAAPREDGALEPRGRGDRARRCRSTRRRWPRLFIVAKVTPGDARRRDAAPTTTNAAAAGATCPR